MDIGCCRLGAHSIAALDHTFLMQVALMAPKDKNEYSGEHIGTHFN